VKSEVNLSQLRDEVNGALASFIKTEVANISHIGEELAPISDALSHFVLDSGKRLRPIFALAGYIGCGLEPTPEIIRACASLELIHVCALIHDDLMDGSDTRRGAPSIHRLFESIHRKEGRAGSAENFGASAAILLGDLALVWSAKMLHESGVDAKNLISALPLYDELRVELMAGQFLDVAEQTMHTSSLSRSMKIASYKSGKYTIERPLHFGAALAGQPNKFEIYSEYGIPLGQAFQLRDDLLGVFGSSELTGKPSGDDLREGKRTALIAKTYELINASQAMTISSAFGKANASPEAIATITGIIESSGARAEIEALIGELTNQSIVAANRIENNKIFLELIDIATKRSA
jgi:geranylgeranyl diphosphate synthase type I